MVGEESGSGRAGQCRGAVLVAAMADLAQDVDDEAGEETLVFTLHLDKPLSSQVSHIHKLNNPHSHLHTNGSIAAILSSSFFPIASQVSHVVA